MRITQDLLHKFASETVKQHQKSEPDLHAAYLTGSLLSDDPLLGGTTDIDLILVHKYKAPVAREVRALTPEVSLDIIHKTQDDYEQHRQLRIDPWLGYPLIHPQIMLFDSDHWLEFIQSSVSAEFHRADNVLARVSLFSNAARKNWLSLIQTSSQTHLEWLHRYLEVLGFAANAVAGLIGPPLTTRRFLLTFNVRVETLGVPKIAAGFNGLLGFSDLHADNLTEWLAALDKDYSNLLATPNPPIHLSACRQAYYMAAIRALADSKDPILAAWPLLRIWLDIKLAETKPSPEQEAWENYLNELELTDTSTEQKTEALDAFSEHEHTLHVETDLPV